MVLVPNTMVLMKLYMTGLHLFGNISLPHLQYHHHWPRFHRRQDLLYMIQLNNIRNLPIDIIDIHRTHSRFDYILQRFPMVVHPLPLLILLVRRKKTT